MKPDLTGINRVEMHVAFKTGVSINKSNLDSHLFYAPRDGYDDFRCHCGCVLSIWENLHVADLYTPDGYDANMNKGGCPLTGEEKLIADIIT